MEVGGGSGYPPEGGSPTQSLQGLSSPPSPPMGPHPPTALWVAIAALALWLAVPGLTPTAGGLWVERCESGNPTVVGGGGLEFGKCRVSFAEGASASCQVFGVEA